VNIFLGNFNVKEGIQDIFVPTVGDSSFRYIRNENEVRIVNFVTSKNLIIVNWFRASDSFHCI
jgi:hypothetical protein